MVLSCSIALDQYYREHITLKAADRRRCEYAIDALNRHLGDTALKDVDIPLCREYASDRAEEGAGAPTARRELGVLRAAASHALRWRRTTLDAMPSIELPPDSQPRRIWMFHNELFHLLETAEKADPRVFLFLELAYYTASRRRAIEVLKWSQIDLEGEKGRINLQSPDFPVTKKRRPIVAISTQMTERLRSVRSSASTAYVLQTPERVYKAFDAIAAKAELSTLALRGMREQGNLTPHVLRHTRATHLLQAGKSPWAVASLLGDTLATVLRVYGHACPDYMAEALN